MSNKSSQAPSVPRGGGALHSIGEKFSADLHTGTGNFTVPIALPPGRNGLQPQINLAYSTGNGHGPFGLGWNLSIPGVGRQTSKGVCRYDKNDVIVLSGAEDLVPVERLDAATRYRPRTEGLFAHIDRHHDANNDYWQVASRDGLISFYGTERPQGASPTWRDPAVIADPDIPSHVFAWKLTATVDPFGNRIDYLYKRDTTQPEGAHHWDQIYLAEIRYADYGDPANPQFMVKVKFVYDDRPDHFSEYRPGFEIRTTRRCSRIEISTNAGTETLARIYHFVYLDQRNLPSPLPLNGVSLLSQIWVEGVDAAPENLLSNSRFETVGANGPSTSFTGLNDSPTAAADWNTWNNHPGTTTTEWLPSTFPAGGTKMIRVTTNADRSGLYRYFIDKERPRVLASAWVYVKRGRVAIGTGNYGKVNFDAISSTTDQWQLLEAPNGLSPANEFIVYSASEGGADFFVANVCVSEKARSEWLPPLEFDYTRFEPSRRDFFPITGTDMPPSSLARPDYELADLFGDGLPDVLQMNGVVRYWRNRGEGRFDAPREMRTAPAGIALADPGVQLIDANGDGRLDLLVSAGSTAGYYPLKFDGLWDSRSFRPYRVAPSFDLKDPEVHLIDLDGDGVTDAIRSSSRFECFFNDPEQGWRGTRWVERRDIEVFPNINFSDPRVKWADMSGDGLQDPVLVYDGNIEYWPSLGYGNWGKRIHMKNSPRFPFGYDPKRILVGDVDGDGLADIVYVDDTKVTLWINQSGNQWSDPIVIEGTPPVSDMDAVRLADMLGAGISGVLWTTDAGGPSRQTMFFLDFTGGRKPYLLNEMNGHIGALTRIEYAPSTRYYHEDQKRLATRWKTALPFPVQVVARVEVIDAISGGKLTTEYSYHHGYWDGAEREFRGFGRVDQRDTETFAGYHAAGLHPDTSFEAVKPTGFSPPTETRTWFLQGPVGDEFGDWGESDYTSEFWQGDPQVLSRPQAMITLLKGLPRRVKRDALRTLRGSVVRTELYALDGTAREGRPYTVTEGLYGLREEMPPALDESDRPRIFFPHSLAQRTTQWERGDDPLTQFSFTDGYDVYGQATVQVAIAVPRTLSDFYLATHTVTNYAQPDGEQPYIVNRVARSTSYDASQSSPSVFALRDKLLGKPASLQVIGQTLNFYDGLAFQGLPLGHIGIYGALVRTESLVLTEKALWEAYKSSVAVLATPEEPPYLARSGAPAWTPEYPQEFRDRLPAMAGYVFHPGGLDPIDERGFFVESTRRKYDFHKPGANVRGLTLIDLDPFGRDTATIYDSFDLMPVEVTDPAGLKTIAAYDYRVLQPFQVTDPNLNQALATFTPLGLVNASWVKGKAGEGDQQRPSAQMTYDFLAFVNRREPVFVRTLRQIHHDTETDVAQPERDETIESIEYSDGFGRLLQTRSQAEDAVFGDRIFGDSGLPADQDAHVGDAVAQTAAPGTPPSVIVSGWQIYDNKGRVVEKYEPFFSSGWSYLQPSDAQRGQKALMFYDPRGHAIRTLNPDGSEQRVVYGVPPGTIASLDLSNPDRFKPSPWEVYTYDANDNAGRTHHFVAASYSDHWDTPSSAVVDALGRVIEAVARNGPNQATDWYFTRSTYDIQGNLLTVWDALGRRAFQHVYDLLKHPLRIDSIDAGLRRSIVDALGNVIEGRDSKGALAIHAYDKLNRPIRLWASDGTGQPMTLRQHMVYGDGDDSGISRSQAANVNLLGKPYQMYDEAGLVVVETYDFKGNALEKVRQVIGDSQLLSAFATAANNNWKVQAYRVDWQPTTGMTIAQHAATLLDATAYRTSSSYDAINRVKLMRYPQDVIGERKQLRPLYNRAGALEHVDLDGTTYVERIAYNAKGQRLLIAYGNGLMTRYVYDPQTFRLARLRTEPYGEPVALTYHPSGAPLQDFAYEYDLAGNITTLRDRTPASGIPNTQLGLDALDRDFTYHPIYSLKTATGRESNTPLPPAPWDEFPKPQDVTLTRRYTELYTYDTVGNIARIQHQAGNGSFDRPFSLVPGNNRLATVTAGQTVLDYTYDTNGNLTKETTSRHFEWDFSDRLRAYRTQPGTAEPPVHAHYLYDAGGQRVKKLARNQGGHYEVTVYVDGAFEYHRVVQGNAIQANNSLHVMDGQRRVALVRVGLPFPKDSAPAVGYRLGDHLGSCIIVVDDTGASVNREEYMPYGETSFGSFARKRYRFTGKERDAESGLTYHGARYYASWLGRWMTADPIGAKDGINIYSYVCGNPITLHDPTGTSNKPANETDTKIMQMTDPQLYRYMMSLSAVERDRLIDRSTRAFSNRAWSMLHKYGMERVHQLDKVDIKGKREKQSSDTSQMAEDKENRRPPSPSSSLTTPTYVPKNHVEGQDAYVITLGLGASGAVGVGGAIGAGIFIDLPNRDFGFYAYVGVAGGLGRSVGPEGNVYIVKGAQNASNVLRGESVSTTLSTPIGTLTLNGTQDESNKQVKATGIGVSTKGLAALTAKTSGVSTGGVLEFVTEQKNEFLRWAGLQGQIEPKK